MAKSAVIDAGLHVFYDKSNSERMMKDTTDKKKIGTKFALERLGAMDKTPSRGAVVKITPPSHVVKGAL
ncbi:hypothetical protein RHS03_02313, partial [Rhizoctonia solani]